MSEFETSVAGFPMRVGGSMPVNIFGSIVSSADVVSAEPGSRGLDMTLEMARLRVAMNRFSRDAMSMKVHYRTSSSTRAEGATE